MIRAEFVDYFGSIYLEYGKAIIITKNYFSERSYSHQFSSIDPLDSLTDANVEIPTMPYLVPLS